MTYATRDMQDADSHIFETPEFYHPFMEKAVKDKAQFLYGASSGFTAAHFGEMVARHKTEEFVATREPELMQRKLWDAMGAFDKHDRVKAMDLLGFKRQIVYDSFLRLQLREYEQGDDMDFLYGLARAHVRAMLDFCSEDERLIAAGYVPLADPARSVEAMKFAIESGCRAVTMAVDCPRHHSPSHEGLEPMWAMAAEAGIPIMYHLGGGRKPSDVFSVTGRRQDKGYAGGDGTFTSVQYLGAPLPFIETLNVLIIDGVLDRHPKLQMGVVEYGANWVPGWMRFLDSAMAAYRKAEERLQLLSMPLSDYVRRQVKFAPFHFEDTGWIIKQAGAEVVLFSSDYPHKEGGRDPISRFESSMQAAGVTEAEKEKFYTGNFDVLMGGPAPESARRITALAS
ncbi:MAG: amidohydrolase [Caulobacter sp.]|nr:amidohydrolase [Caulobacter sp.]